MVEICCLKTIPDCQRVAKDCSRLAKKVMPLHICGGKIDFWPAGRVVDCLQLPPYYSHRHVCFLEISFLLVHFLEVWVDAAALFYLLKFLVRIWMAH